MSSTRSRKSINAAMRRRYLEAKGKARGGRRVGDIVGDLARALTRGLVGDADRRQMSAVVDRALSGGAR